MPCHTYETTNARLAIVIEEINELIGWAEADADHAEENGAKDTARDDRWRAKRLVKALNLIADCQRTT